MFTFLTSGLHRLLVLVQAVVSRSGHAVRRLGSLLAAIVLALSAQGQAQAQVNNAAFISQSVPGTMVAGQTYRVSVTMQNTGSSTWSAGAAYKLGSQNPVDNSTWGSRALLSSNVLPGQQYTFGFDVKAPAVAGTYQFQWKMLREFVEWFGAPTTNVAISVTPPAPVNAAAFVSQSIVSSMTASGTYRVSVTMRNTGTTTWTPAEGYRLGSQNPGDNYTWGNNRVALTAPVAPGAQHTFSFSVAAPAFGGVYQFQWRMVREYVEWFGSASPSAGVTVSGPAAPADSATFVSQSVPATMAAGSSHNVSVTMRNSGTATWSAAQLHRLGSENPSGNTTWTSSNGIALTTPVAPGQQHTFSFTVSAPAVAGTYNFQWRMLRNTSRFGALSSNAAIVVSVPATATSVTYFHNDASGTPMLATDPGGAVLWKETYWPYGEKVNRPVAGANNRLWFTGKPQDQNTNLIYMGARYYDPLLGRFTGMDPEPVDPGNLHSVNRYAYANNNPYRFVDPDGHSPIDIAFLAYDLTKLGVALYTGVGVGPAMMDVGASLIGVGSPIPFAGQALKAARAVERGVETARAGERAASAGRKAEQAVEGMAQKVHGNSHSTTKPAEGYSLRDRCTGECLKYGETTMGTKRYSEKYLKENNAFMKFEAKGSKKEMHQWQHQKILEHKENNGGVGPILNKSEW